MKGIKKMTSEDKKLELQILLEEYKTVSEELRIYVKEMIQCFPYAAILIAIYLGWGIAGDNNQAYSIANRIQEYVPYGFVLLSVYFLGLAYIRVGLSRYRAYLENKINEIAGNELMHWDSSFAYTVQSSGFLKLGEAWYARLPTPLLFLGFLIAAGSIIVFTSDIVHKQTVVILSLLLACGLTALYIFFVYPKLIDRANKFVNKGGGLSRNKKK